MSSQNTKSYPAERGCHRKAYAPRFARQTDGRGDLQRIEDRARERWVTCLAMGATIPGWETGFPGGVRVRAARRDPRRLGEAVDIASAVLVAARRVRSSARRSPWRRDRWPAVAGEDVELGPGAGLVNDVRREDLELSPELGTCGVEVALARPGGERSAAAPGCWAVDLVEAPRSGVRGGLRARRSRRRGYSRWAASRSRWRGPAASAAPRPAAATGLKPGDRAGDNRAAAGPGRPPGLLRRRLHKHNARRLGAAL